MGTEVLLSDDEDVLAAANSFGNGRAVYFSALPFSADTTRLLLRAMYWATKNEAKLKTWFSSNPKIECTAFEDAKKLVVLNNSLTEEKTTIYNGEGKGKEITIAPFASKFFDYAELK